MRTVALPFVGHAPAQSLRRDRLARRKGQPSRALELLWMLSVAWLFTGLLGCGGAEPGAGATFGDGPSGLALKAGLESTGSVDIPSTAPKVVFLGDSITAGLHLPERAAFPAILQQQLAVEGLPFHLVNAGVSGDTSSGGLRRLDWLLKGAPDVLVLELGGNDGLRGQALAGIERNLRKIIAQAQAAGTKVLLLGMRIPPSYGREYAASFAALYDNLAAELEIAYVPYFMEGVGGVPALNLEDGLHPNQRGHELLAQNVIAALRELLRED